MAKEFIFDSQADWETGKMSGMVAVDPAGKLSLATDVEQIAALVDAGSLAVYCRASEGSGTVLHNLGLAGDGTLNSGSWLVREDGRHYLTAGQVQIPYHSSMAVAGDDNKAYVLSAGLRIRLSALSEQVFMQRSGRFALGLDSNGYPYLSYETASGTNKAVSKQKLETGKWYALVGIVGGGGMALYVNGAMVAQHSGFTPKDDPHSGDLVIACSGDFTDFVYSGDGTQIGRLVQQPTSGMWERKIDFGEDEWTLQYFAVDTIKSEREHTISVSIAFANSEDELPFSKEWSWTPKGGEDLFVPPEMGLIYGRWASIRIRTSTMDWDRSQPLIDKLRIVFRQPAVPLSEYKDDEYIGDEYLSPPEEKAPEDLDAALEEIRKLKANVTTLKRRVGGFSASFAGFNRRVSTLEDKVSDISPAQAAAFVGFWTRDPVLAAEISGNPTWQLLALQQRMSVVEKQISGLQQTDLNYAQALGVHSASISSLQESVSGLQSSLTAHIGRVTNVHGVSDGSAVASLNNVDGAIQQHDQAQNPHAIKNWASVSVVDSKISASSSDVKDYADGLVSDHNSSASAHSARGWQTERDVQDIAESVSDYAITGHQNRCNNYAL